MNVCPFCHAPTRAGALFCAMCGRPFVLQGSVRAYTVVRVLKSGGMASVYEAECSGVRYAIKEMLDTFTDAKARQEAINRFMHEALTLARLNHPRIPKIHEHFTERGRFYLVMDFVEGQDLEDVLTQRAGNPLPESQVLHWADQICDVLEYLHAQQPPLIFRDLKPSNIMLTPTNDVRLIDFGIAKLFTPGQQGTMIGTPGYAAPEQYQGLAEPRTDVYGLGATLHHLLTGRDPQRHPPFAFPSARQLNPAVTAQTDAAVERAVKMDLYARFGSAQEMRAALTVGQTPPRLPLPALVAGIVILVLVAFGLGVASVLWLFTPTLTPIASGMATLAPTLTIAPPTRAPTAALPTTALPTPAPAIIVVTATPLPSTATPRPPTVPPSPAGLATRLTDARGVPMVLVPAGPFTMGSDPDVALAECKKLCIGCDCKREWYDDEYPPHTVTLSAFYIDQYEVTNARYKQCVEAGNCSRPSSTSSSTRGPYYGDARYDNYPVIYVNWEQAKAYCEWRGSDTRLPTEAEWEKAARGTDGRLYPWGDTFDKNRVNSWEGGKRDMTEVGSYPSGASPYGALDMAGNVWEWVADWYQMYPGGKPLSDFGEKYRVVRGGAWHFSGSRVRAAYRDRDAPSAANDLVGFRCARSP
jgi:serine/threonine-protein kinase